MTRSSSKRPVSFESEKQEADWYGSPAGRREAVRALKQAIKNGTLIRSEGGFINPDDPAVLQQLLNEAKAKALRAVSLRLSIADIELAKTLAAKEDIPYQKLLKRVIHDGLSSYPTAPPAKHASATR